MAIDNGSFGLSNFAAGANDALQDMLARKFAEQLDRQRRADQLAREVEDRRRFDARHQLDVENSGALREQRETAAADREAVTKARTARDQFISGLTTEPSAFYKMPKALRIIAAGQHGISLGEHAVESPDEHTAHLTAERQSEFDEWKRRQDYDEQQLRTRPVRIRGAQPRPTDDPTLPRGSQLYALEIARKHGGDWASAQAEALTYLNDQQTAQDHARLSPDKFMSAVRRAMGRPTMGRQDVYSMPGDVLAQTATTPKPAPSSGGRGGNPSAVSQKYRWSDSSVRAHPEPDAQPQQQRAPSKAGRPNVGERRTINGQLAEWDGKGWLPVNR